MSTITSESVAASVRAAVEDAGLSQGELARRTGIARVTLNRRLAGRGRPFLVSELFVISQCVGVGIVELVTGGTATA